MQSEEQADNRTGAPGKMTGLSGTKQLVVDATLSRKEETPYNVLLPESQGQKSGLYMPCLLERGFGGASFGTKLIWG